MQCPSGKRQYKTNADARIEMKAMKREGRDHGQIYHCPDCGDFHIGRAIGSPIKLKGEK